MIQLASHTGRPNTQERFVAVTDVRRQIVNAAHLGLISQAETTELHELVQGAFHHPTDTGS
jgi:hypothetical protein